MYCHDTIFFMKHSVYEQFVKLTVGSELGSLFVWFFALLFLCCLLLLPPPRRICLFVCLLVTLHQNFRTDLHEMKFSGKVGNGPVNKWLNFVGDPDRRSVWTVSRYTGKTCLGGGMHCSSASSCAYFIQYWPTVRLRRTSPKWSVFMLSGT